MVEWKNSINMVYRQPMPALGIINMAACATENMRCST